jgi:uncharacterized protein YecT (DUF1311 family)
LLLEEHDEAAEPIIKDLSVLRSTLARLFEVRHILVHEFPRSRPYKPGDIDLFLDAALDFTHATEETLLLAMYGRYPITQSDMTAQARSQAQAALNELDGVVQQIAKFSPSIFEVQKLWDQFKDAEAHRVAEGFEGGTAHPMVYYFAASDLANNRTGQLRESLELHKREAPEEFMSSLKTKPPGG